MNLLTDLLDLPGPQFLGAYAVLFGVALVLLFVIRRAMRGAGDEPSAGAADLSSLETAYLCGGPNRVIDAAVLRLVHREVVALDAAEGHLTRRAKEPPANAHPVEQAIFNATEGEGGMELPGVRERATPAAQQLRGRLESLGLVVPQSKMALIRMAAAAPGLLVVLLGLTKMFLGMSRDRPVGFLVMMLIGSVVVLVILSTLLRTRRGDRLLARLKDENAALEFSARRADNLLDSDLVLAVAVFGPAVLLGGPLAAMPAALYRSPARAASSSSDSSWWSWSSSCGSSSGGDGGCGGWGGCGGGGGCGGCSS